MKDRGLSNENLGQLKSAIDEAAILAITDKHGAITYANKKFCEISGYSEAELIGSNHRIVNSGFHPKNFFIDMWKAISTGKTWEGEICNRAKNGDIYWVHTTIVPFMNEMSKPETYVAVRYDITERKQAEENLKTLFNSTFEGILVIKGTFIEDANHAAENIFGRASRDMIGHNLTDFIRNDRQTEFKKSILEEMGNAIESVGLRSDGSEIPLLIQKREVTLQGQEKAIIAVRDLTLRKNMEAQILRQDRLASLGLLASSLAHEIGTPLGVIRGRAQFISDKSKEEKVKGDMGLIIAQIDRVAKLVNSLLHLAREKKSDLTVPVNVKAVIEDVVRLLQHEFERKDIKLEIFCSESDLVHAEAGPLGQVILNLLVNSVHAIEEVKKKDGRKDHKVSISVFDENKTKIIAISDSGTGIDESNLKHLFKPFFTTKDIGVGTGLGLATSYRLVQSWNGTMDVSSKLGHGTTFKIRLQKPN